MNRVIYIFCGAVLGACGVAMAHADAECPPPPPCVMKLTDEDLIKIAAMKAEAEKTLLQSNGPATVKE